MRKRSERLLGMRVLVGGAWGSLDLDRCSLGTQLGRTCCRLDWATAWLWKNLLYPSFAVGQPGFDLAGLPEVCQPTKTESQLVSTQVPRGKSGGGAELRQGELSRLEPQNPSRILRSATPIYRKGHWPYSSPSDNRDQGVKTRAHLSQFPVGTLPLPNAQRKGDRHDAREEIE